ncbi:hypothetical protein B0H13DRAFT_1913046 [Mycena leptocephala]|nr:hypothetical protein B0H13DRAFT_1913046 [Mycena leptocephala]
MYRKHPSRTSIDVRPSVGCVACTADIGQQITPSTPSVRENGPMFHVLVEQSAAVEQVPSSQLCRGCGDKKNPQQTRVFGNHADSGMIRWKYHSNSARDLVAKLRSLAGLHPYFGAVVYLFLAAQSKQDWETVKGQVGSLTSEAAIATFLAAVQSQILALSYQDNSTCVKTATNALGFAGVLLDVITACLALLASTILQRHVAILADIWTFLQSAEPRNLPPDIARRFLIRMRVRLTALAKTLPQDDAHGGDDIRFTLPMESTQLNVAAISPSLKNIRSATSIGDAAGTAMLFGVLCFFASVLCLAVSTQPPVVWIVLAGTCALVVALPVTNYVLGLAGILLSERPTAYATSYMAYIAYACSFLGLGFRVCATLAITFIPSLKPFYKVRYDVRREATTWAQWRTARACRAPVAPQFMDARPSRSTGARAVPVSN